MNGQVSVDMITIHHFLSTLLLDDRLREEGGVMLGLLIAVYQYCRQGAVVTPPILMMHTHHIPQRDVQGIFLDDVSSIVYCV